MGHPMFAYGVMPCVKPVAFLNPSLRRDLPIVPITVLKRGMCVCVCLWLCSTNPLFKPHLPPLLPFLFHTLSAVLTHSFWARPKTGRAAPAVRNSCPQVNPDGRDFVTHSVELLFRSAEETWRWFIRPFIVYHSMDFLICYLHIKVTIISAFCDYFEPVDIAWYASFHCKTIDVLLKSLTQTSVLLQL